MVDKKGYTQLSKFLSLVLRHNPDAIGIELDSNGWADVKDLIEKMNSSGKHIDLETLEAIIETSSKKRFRFNEDKSLIRASQGHSIEIDLGYEAKVPPRRLFHGTGAKYVDSIYESGIQKRNRHHVHLSKDIETALSVGQRHGRPVVFEILTDEMTQEGFDFYESENGVWLTDEIPARFIRRIEE